MRTEEELMSAYAAGDDEAFAELFSSCAPAVLGFLRKHGLAAEAEDLLQQTFLQLHRARRDYRRGAPLRPWLLTIARNLSWDHLRRRRRAPPAAALAEEEVAGAASPLAPLSAREDVRAAVERLPEPQRKVIEAHWFDHLPLPTVADRLGLSLSAVKARAHRAYGTLRRELKSWSPDDGPDNGNRTAPPDVETRQDAPPS